MRFPLILIIGKSGSGKTRVACELEKYGLTQVVSYTNRPMRVGEQDGVDHIFLKGDNYSLFKRFERKIACSTIYNGYLYFSTKDKLDLSDVYVITPKDADRLRSESDRQCIIIWLRASLLSRIKRMRSRGDRWIHIASKIIKDTKSLSEKSLQKVCDDIIKTDDKTPEQIAKEIYDRRELLYGCSSIELNYYD